LVIYRRKGGNHGLQIKGRSLWDSKKDHSEEGTSKEEIAFSSDWDKKGVAEMPSLFCQILSL
jgi:hypothetical protein